MTCSREVLARLVCGALSRSRERKTFEHLSGCPGCRRELAALAVLERTLASRRPSLATDFATFLVQDPKWWLAPLAVVAAAIAVIVIFAEGSAIAPFIYSIF